MATVHGVPTVMAPPPGYVVDFNNPQRRLVTEAYAVAAVENVLAIVFLAQRLYTKIFVMKQFVVEDGLVIAAWFFSIGTQVCLLVGFEDGVIGTHAWEMTLGDFSLYSRLILAAPLIYAPCTAFAKASLCLFYGRVDPRPFFQYVVWTTLFVCVGAYTSIFFALFFACTPVSASWDPSLLPTAVCVNRGAIYIATAVIGVVTDVVLVCLPIPTVIGLQMSKKQKIGLVGMFVLGSLTMVTSIIRLVVLMPSLSTMDQTWVIAEGSLWIIVESNLLVMCCCLPTLRKFFKHLVPHLFSDAAGSDPSGPKTSKICTIGSTGNRQRKFDTLMNTVDDPECDGDILLDTRRRDAPEKQNATLTVKTFKADDDSEEVILYERTVDVTYEGMVGTSGQNQAHMGKVWVA